MTQTITDYLADREWLDEILSTIEYREGWTFEVATIGSLGCGTDGLHLLVQACVPCNYRDDMATVTIRQWANVGGSAAMRDRSHLLRIIHNLIAKIEGHERLEYLKVGGEHAFDPHPNGPTEPRWSP